MTAAAEAQRLADLAWWDAVDPNPPIGEDRLLPGGPW